ncbi:MAG: hypothetical protein D6765_12115 [Bacteroidetes bacterium]|nr:MAG: hypothetical protein D6765_12115 [Bacteroidota bacterium]
MTHSVKKFFFLAALSLLLACSHLMQFQSAQDAFNQGAELENRLRLEQNAYLGTSPETYYSLAYAQVREALKRDGQLAADGVKGNALALKALCEWKLGKYEAAHRTAQQAILELEKDRNAAGVPSRDWVVMKALDGLIAIEKANAGLNDLRRPDPQAAPERLQERYSALIWNEEDAQQGHIEQALRILDQAAQLIHPGHDVQLYLAQSALAALKVWSDALDAVKNTLDTHPNWTIPQKKALNDWRKTQRELFLQQRRSRMENLAALLAGGKDHPLYARWRLLLGGE